MRLNRIFSFSLFLCYKTYSYICIGKKKKLSGIMKRLGLTLVAALCLAATTFAAGNQPTTAKWEGNINVSKLGKYLNLNSVQSEEVANICDYFSEQMSRATTAKKDKEAKLRNAVYGNLKLMRKTLSAEQYAKYAALMNITLQNKGIELNK